MDASRLFEHVLVGVDSAGLASNAVVQGAALARELGATLDLVSAVEIPSSLLPGLSGKELDTLHSAALDTGREEVLASLADTLRETHLDGRAGELLEVHPGHPAKVILERARKIRADLILLGHHARRPVFDFGATARAILSRTELPVWIQPGPVTPIRQILVPIDFSEHSRRALEWALALAERLSATVRVMHCFVPPAFAYANATDGVPGPTYVIDQQRDLAKRQFERWVHELDQSPVPLESTFIEGESAAEILREADSDDMIVMGTHGRTGLSRFLIGSVAYAVLKQSSKPVLVVPSPGRAWQLTASEADESHTRPERSIAGAPAPAS